MTIIPLTKEHWPEVESIYLDGITSGHATFETKSPGWDKWNATHLPHCRYVGIIEGEVVGWAALLPVSARKAYEGVAEESVYIKPTNQGQGLGYKLLTHLINAATENGIYSLQAVMFPENKATVRLHEKCGFRKIGIKEKIAKQYGVWRDTVLYERRSEK